MNITFYLPTKQQAAAAIKMLYALGITDKKSKTVVGAIARYNETIIEYPSIIVTASDEFDATQARPMQSTADNYHRNIGSFIQAVTDALKEETVTLEGQQATIKYDSVQIGSTYLTYKEITILYNAIQK